MNQPHEIRPHFSREIREWLGTYREKFLGCPEMGAWRGRPYPHILSENDRAKGGNLLETIRTEFERYSRKKQFKYHRDFAHLNSSQALAFNLFFPFLPSADSGLPWAVPEKISDALKVGDLVEADFEKIIDRSEGTNLDWWGRCHDGGQIFCEVKFTESTFGTASSRTTDYGERFERIYRSRLEGVVRAEFLGDLIGFKENYQILRNLAHLPIGEAPDRNRVLFVLPERSPTYGHLIEFLDRATVRKRVVVKGLESWTSELANSAASEEERRHWEAFRVKYCPELS